ncbi:cAMP-dependent protein kinase catalytic subunit [Symbiodinium microadriaticum]|uniref:cAMP-dependent protein kinase catalytic subunit n=1 Tax=Symbiodinium microadriaticum TaxID=2951 RepID=A0A1Q9E295_SYMMI|nr:cAMP-dependent protein kinase catalytic subunit [Symbiodinium microadriaticum]
MVESILCPFDALANSFEAEDLKTVKVIGAGAAGVVRLVMNKKTGECELLKAQEHPFIMRLVQTFETSKSAAPLQEVYILTELITGGELHGAIREIPTVLSRAQAQFYTGCLVIVLEDLKPENVMLDAQGYLKLIDFGIAKKLEEGKTRTFTMIGTPHYMAPEIMRGYLPFADELDDPTEVCTAVFLGQEDSVEQELLLLKDPLDFPGRFKDAQCKTVIQGMLNRQPKKRLGAGARGVIITIVTVKHRHHHHDYQAVTITRTIHIIIIIIVIIIIIITIVVVVIIIIIITITSANIISDFCYPQFDKIMGRELEAPVVPKGETYCEPSELDVALSDDNELG